MDYTNKNGVLVPKQILFAPMLSTFGGGSARGFNPGGSADPDPGEAIFLLKDNATQPTATFSWTVPALVTEVSVVCVGGGGGAGGYGGGAGGELGYKNAISVSPGASITVQVGAGGLTNTNDGDMSYFSSNTVCYGGGGERADVTQPQGGDYTGDGGGDGGNANNTTTGTGGVGTYVGSGGGGAGGYSGNGGLGGHNGGNGFAGSGGGGGGGGSSYDNLGYGYGYGGGGGGVGLYGQGSNGTGGTGGLNGNTGTMAGLDGGGGSGGADGSDGFSNRGGNVTIDGSTITNYDSGGLFGGGGGNGYQGGGAGAVRVIWGTGRAFPSTDVNSDYNVTVYRAT